MTLLTLNETLKNSVNIYGDRVAFKVKEEGKFKPITYKEFYKKVEKFGTGLLSLGLEKFDHVGLVSNNRFEWIIADLAIIGLRAVDVPCSGDSSSNDIQFKLSHSESKATILEGEKQFIDFSQISKNLPLIKNIILFDKINIFSESGEESPEWTTQMDFQENGEISKKLYSHIRSMIDNKNKVVFLSIKSKEFLENYFKQNIENLLRETSSKEKAESVKNSILNRAIVISKNYNEKNAYKVYSFEEVSRIGEDLLAKGNTSFSEISKTAKPDDLVTIIYTSGTTADPKGVMLTNSNFMHNLRTAPPFVGIHKEDRFLSVLPSWHIYERTVEYCAITVGASTAYSKPFKQVLLPDLLEEKPTLMCSVPRIWTSLEKGIKDNVRNSSSIQRKIFNYAIRIGEKYKEAEGILKNTFPLFDRSEYSPEEIKQAQKTVKSLGWKYRLVDKIVFNKIRKVTGGSIRFVISGGGALPQSTDIFFNIIGIKICEGYGLTETSPILSGRVEKHNIIFTVGPPLPEVEIKIVDKYNLDKELPHGEIGIVLTKGPMVMKGYYKNEEKTNEVIKNGWFNTGDLGRKTFNGKYIKLLGRIKDTIVLRGGENIEPLPLEDKLKESDYINMVIIVGQDKTRIGALIVPNFDSLKRFATKNNIDYKDADELLKNKDIISLFQKEQRRLISKENGFKPYETVMGIALIPKEFTIEDGDLTETLKMKRFEIHKKYHKEIDRICG